MGSRIVACLGLLAALPASGPAAQARLSERATVGQTVAGTTITVEYSRPVARGRDSLFGKVVTWGEHWTPGADWATTLEVDKDVKVEGRALPEGKYSVWTIVRPDTWTVELHRRARIFHVNRPDRSDLELEVKVPVARGPRTDVLTFDFPELVTGGATLRFRWGELVVPLHVTAIPPPLELVPAAETRARYLGRYDLTVLVDPPEPQARRRVIEVVERGDTLRWRDVNGPAELRREFVLTPIGVEDQFARARRAADGAYWKDPGLTVAFTVDGRRASGFQVEVDNGMVVARAERVR